MPHFARVILLTALLLFVALGVKPVSAHELRRPSRMGLTQRHDYQKQILHHAEAVQRWFSRRGLRFTQSRRPPLGTAAYALWWHIKQERWLRREIGETEAAIQQVLVGPQLSWLCIHGHEGDWEDGGNPYWGGLQMDLEFIHTYAMDMIKKYGEPRGRSGPNGWENPWTPTEQMIVANRARRGYDWRGRYIGARGFYPWPNTARYCRLI